jgi:arylsulfatase A-like enzyme
MISRLAFLLSFLCVSIASAVPNIILILADDLGWADTTLYGHTKLYETPNLERLAARGMTFTNAYAASPLCSPTRASILTGQTPARHGITAPRAHQPKVILKATARPHGPPNMKATVADSASQLNTTLPTLGKLMKQAGYDTAHFGKWHLGKPPYSPLEQGFDVDIPHWPGPGPAGSFVAPWKFPYLKAKKPKEHIEDRMAEEAIAWLKKRDPKKPFFMNYWQFSVHAPFDAKADLIERYTDKIDRKDSQHSPTYAAMVHSLDDAVGSLLDAVDAAGIADNTVFVFFSDNGGNMYNGITETDADGKSFVTVPTSNRPLRGGKGSMYEGGIRVPAVISWPGMTLPGSKSDTRIQSTDLYPTILKMAGGAWPDDHVVDGKDLAPALKGQAFDRGPMITYFPHATQVPHWLPSAVAVHHGNWKLIRLFHHGENGAHDYRLYDLSKDIGEAMDVAPQYGGRVKHDRGTFEGRQGGKATAEPEI